jgi:fructose-bisphosphate aldolase / 2-amino-3,7-dideoxy-D-threo-hept-6-ulosonate synthase
MATSMGKTLRLARLFDPDSGTAVMLPMDHAIEEPDYTELERPLALVEGLARADVIKTWYTGDPESFRRVLDYSLVPVVVAGGPRAASERGVLELVRGAMDAGAAGVATGRKIWQSRDPVGLARAVSAIIRQGASVDAAMGAPA